MSFFDSVPPTPPCEPEPYTRPSYMQPEAVIPGSVPGEFLLLRTEKAVVAIGGIFAYPNGFEFTAHVRRRGNVHASRFDPFDRFGRHSPEASGHVLRLGLLYADGRRGATTGGGPWVPGDPDHLLLAPGGGGGSPLRYDSKFWVHPLPPDGPVTFVAAWPEYGAAESRAEVDGATIRAAAARAVTLWPEEESKPPGPSMNRVTFTVRKTDEPGSEAEPDAAN